MIDKKENLIASAADMRAYVDKASLSDIQQNLRVGAQEYARFSKHHYTALIYGKLALEHYYFQCTALHELPDTEREILEKILALLKSLYEKPRKNPVANFNSFLTNVHFWLDNCVLNNTHPALTKTACFALYAIMTLFNTKLNNLTLKEQATLRFFSVDREKTKAELIALINKIEVNITLLPQVTVLNTEPQHPPPTIQDYIHEQCLHFFEQPQLALTDKIAQIKAFLVDVERGITQLIEENTFLYYGSILFI